MVNTDKNWHQPESGIVVWFNNGPGLLVRLGDRTFINDVFDRLLLSASSGDL